MKKSRTLFRTEAAFLSLIILFWTASAAFAAAEEILPPGAEKKGSIFVTLADETGVTPMDGVLTLYQVMGQDAEITEDFSLEDLLQNYLSVPREELLEFLGSDAGTDAEIGRDGSACFYDLSEGVYLILQKINSDGYYPITPFLVSIPLDVGGELVYEVDASPKTEALMPLTEKEKQDEEAPPAEPENLPEKPETETDEPKTEASEAEKGALPQTGQLNWPIPVLAGGGLLLIVIGLLLSRKKKRHVS